MFKPDHNTYVVDFEYDGTPDRIVSMGIYQYKSLLPYKPALAAHVIFKDHLDDIRSPWVRENVIPLLDTISGDEIGHREFKKVEIYISQIGEFFADFFAENNHPLIVADFGLDIAMFAKLTFDEEFNTYPCFKGVDYKHLRIDAYPTVYTYLKQHHALDDAKALALVIMGMDEYPNGFVWNGIRAPRTTWIYLGESNVPDVVPVFKEQAYRIWLELLTEENKPKTVVIYGEKGRTTVLDTEGLSAEDIVKKIENLQN